MKEKLKKLCENFLSVNESIYQMGSFQDDEYGIGYYFFVFFNPINLIFGILSICFDRKSKTALKSILIINMHNCRNNFFDLARKIHIGLY